MKPIRSPITQTRRDAWTEVNLSHIEHNLNELKKILNPGVKIMAVVKADAYGHGATMVAKTMEASGVKMFGVAAVDEGIQLRIAHIKLPILILGPTPSWALTSAVEYDLDVTIFSFKHLNECIETAIKLQQPVNIHIKVDTGMNRIGINYKQALDLIEAAQKSKEIRLTGIFSHLACAEDPEISQLQIQRWNEVIEKITHKPPLIHFTNSAGTICYKNMHHNLIRSGLELYGLQPDLIPGIQPLNLKQAMELKARITHIHNAYMGEGVSYGFRYLVKEQEITIATVPVGYADGVSRNLSGKLEGIINSNKVPQIGVITMDQMMFNISGVERVSTGDIITLLGEQDGFLISIDEWAKKLNTINYEIPCLLKVRLPRVYTS